MIGNLRERLTLLAPLRVPDAGGGYEIQYETRAEVPARSESLTSRRDRVAGRHLGLHRQRFTIRHRDDLVFEMRLSHRDRTYRITDIQSGDEKNRFAVVVGEEVR